jgi:hypothetical protein
MMSLLSRQLPKGFMRSITLTKYRLHDISTISPTEHRSTLLVS